MKGVDEEHSLAFILVSFFIYALGHALQKKTLVKNQRQLVNGSVSLMTSLMYVLDKSNCNSSSGSAGTLNSKRKLDWGCGKLCSIFHTIESHTTYSTL